MSVGSNNSQGCAVWLASWFKWLIGTIIALLAAGSGIVALLNYFNSQPLPSALPAVISTSTPTPYRQMLPVTPRPTAPPETFSGVYGTARLDWSAHGISYVGIAKLSGPIGGIAVEYYSPDVGAKLTVLQDLELQSYQGNWFYVGHNPTYASIGQPANYSPDTFKLSPISTGGWTIIEMCDLQGVCALVTTTPLN